MFVFVANHMGLQQLLDEPSFQLFRWGSVHIDSDKYLTKGDDKLQDVTQGHNACELAYITLEHDWVVRILFADHWFDNLTQSKLMV